jgi:SAM-dependent methyltransferase
MTHRAAFDLFANDYDAWFGENRDLLESEVRLLAHIWPKGATSSVLSVGCGTGLFEAILARDHGIEVTHGVEPAEGMAAIARERGMDVVVGTAEEADLGVDAHDLLLFNGSTSYVKDLERVFRRAHAALRPGGHVLVVDVPRESGYGVLYCLAKELGTWDHPVFEGVKPSAAYPIPFVQAATWHTTAERVAALEAAGFEVVGTAQTLTRHPVNAPVGVEEPRDGHDAGDYVAILAKRP